MSLWCLRKGVFRTAAVLAVYVCPYSIWLGLSGLKGSKTAKKMGPSFCGHAAKDVGFEVEG